MKRGLTGAEAAALAAKVGITVPKAPARKRKIATDPERFEKLLALHLRANGVRDFEQQYRYTREIGRMHRADFAFPSHRLLVEVQGGIWRRGGGAHSHPQNIERDVEKHQLAAILGWRVLPVTTDEVENGRAIDVILKALEWREIAGGPG